MFSAITQNGWQQAMNHPVDKRGILDEGIFSYRITKDRKVYISWNGKHVTTLVGRKAETFIAAVRDSGEKAAQLIMAKATGNFKRGNERK